METNTPSPAPEDTTATPLFQGQKAKYCLIDTETGRLEIKTLTERAETAEKAWAEMRDALRANHLWHQDHDELEGYPNSDLCSQNVQALSLSSGLNYVPASSLRELEVQLAASREDEKCLRQMIANLRNIINSCEPRHAKPPLPDDTLAVEQENG